jgi:4-amino-4-deoxy-L-arabinose transferase-like glycosyltransferase
MSNGPFRFRQALLLLLYLALALLHSAVNPLFETSDEMWHIGMAVRLARGEGLPVQRPGEETPWRQEGSQPPLYYIMLAALTQGLALPLSDFEEIYFRNPHTWLGNPSQIANRNQVIHSPRERFPWHGAILTLHLWRLVSVALGLLTVLATVNAIRLLFPDRPGWALGAGLLVALNPMFLFIAGSVNNDNLVNAATAVGLWVLALIWRRGPSWPRAVLLGVVLGVAALAKLSGLTLWPLAALVLVGAYHRDTKTHNFVPSCLRGLIITFGVALALCGWWFWRNWLLYRDPTGLSVMLDIVGRRHATPADLLREFQGFRWSFWGVFGGMNVLMPVWIYHLLDAWTALAALGLLVRAGRGLARALRTRTWGEEWLIGWGLLGYVGVLFAAFLRWTSQTPASQGRLMFPAIGPISLGLWVGWEAVSRAVGRSRRLGPVLQALPIVFLGGLALLAPVLWIAPAYRPPDLPIPAEIPHPLEATFGDEFRLLGYDLRPSALEPGETVDLILYLETLRPPTRDWSLFVHLVDDLEIILAQDDRYPRQGLVRATQLPAGERWAEVFRLRVPDTAVAPARLSLRMGFYDLHTWERIPVVGQDDSLRYVSFGDLALRPRPGLYPNPVSYRFGDRIELVGYEMVPRRVRPGEAVVLTLYWRAMGPTEHDYTVFTHILEPPQTIWGQEDRPPTPPTSQWRAGEVYRETYTLRVKPETPPGFYEVEIGLYRPDTGERLRLPDGRDFLLLSRIRVP